MKQSGVTGTVVVTFIVDARGKVQVPRVVKSSHPGFEQAAIDAILGWKFQPAEMNGQPVSTRVGQSMAFALHPDEPPAPGPKRPGGLAPTGEARPARQFDKPPKPLKRVPPVFPQGMARAGLIGAVKVEFIIDEEGRVRDAYVLESNNPWFERPAVDAVMEWTFQPGEKDGHPVRTRTQQLLVFELDRGGHVPELWQVSKGKGHDKQPAEFQWDTPPTPKSTMFPVYPFAQLEAGTEGQARISYVVGPDGSVIGAMVREATTPEFGLAAMATIDAWRFNPAKKKDGTPACANLAIEYRFRTNGRGDVPVSDQARWILRDLAKDPAAIVAARELDQPLQPVVRHPPTYPSTLAQSGQAGEALIEFFVDDHGDVQLPRIISSSAPEFGYAAAQAVATWRFAPPRAKKKPVTVRVQIPILFSLPGGPAGRK